MEKLSETLIHETAHFPTTKLNPVLFACRITHIINRDVIVYRWIRKGTMHNQQNPNLSFPLKVLNYIRIWLTPTKI